MLRCRIGDCARPSKIMGLCGAHYQRHIRGRPLEPPIRPTGGTVRYHVRPSRELLEAVQARAAALGITTAEAIRRALAAWIR